MWNTAGYMANDVAYAQGAAVFISNCAAQTVLTQNAAICRDSFDS